MKQHFRHHNKFQTLTQEKYFVKYNLYIQETIDYIETMKTALKIIHSILILVSLFFNYLIGSKVKPAKVDYCGATGLLVIVFGRIQNGKLLLEPPLLD